MSKYGLIVTIMELINQKLGQLKVVSPETLKLEPLDEQARQAILNTLQKPEHHQALSNMEGATPVGVKDGQLILVEDKPEVYWMSHLNDGPRFLEREEAKAHVEERGLRLPTPEEVRFVERSLGEHYSQLGGVYANTALAESPRHPGEIFTIHSNWTDMGHFPLVNRRGSYIRHGDFYCLLTTRAVLHVPFQLEEAEFQIDPDLADLMKQYEEISAGDIVIEGIHPADCGNIQCDWPSTRAIHLALTQKKAEIMTLKDPQISALGAGELIITGSNPGMWQSVTDKGWLYQRAPIQSAERREEYKRVSSATHTLHFLDLEDVDFVTCRIKQPGEWRYKTESYDSYSY